MQESGNQYAISEYPDVDLIYRKLDALIQQPIRPLRREKLQEVLTYFDEKCVKSRQLKEEKKKVIINQHRFITNVID